MSVNLEHKIIHEWHEPEVREGDDIVAHARSLRMCLEENGDVLCIATENGATTVIRLNNAALSAINAAVTDRNWASFGPWLVRGKHIYPADTTDFRSGRKIACFYDYSGIDGRANARRAAACVAACAGTSTDQLEARAALAKEPQP